MTMQQNVVLPEEIFEKFLGREHSPSPDPTSLGERRETSLTTPHFRRCHCLKRTLAPLTILDPPLVPVKAFQMAVMLWSWECTCRSGDALGSCHRLSDICTYGLQSIQGDEHPAHTLV